VRLERTETQSSCRDHDGDAKALPEEKGNDELDAGELRKRPVQIDEIVWTTDKVPLHGPERLEVLVSAGPE
jgi:hypothetical protein